MISNVKSYEQEYELEVEIEKLIEEISTLEFQIKKYKIDQLIEQEVKQKQSKELAPSIEELKQMKKSITKEKATESEGTLSNNEIEKNKQLMIKK